MGLHAGGRAVLVRLSEQTAVDPGVLADALRTADHTAAQRVWAATGRDGFAELRDDADAAAVSMVDSLTSAGVPWPMALQRAAEGYGLPPGQADAYAASVRAPVMPPSVLSDAGDVAVGAWAAQTVSKTHVAPVSKADEEEWVEVVRGNRRYRQRVLRDDEGQFASQGEGERQVAELGSEVLSAEQIRALTPEERRRYTLARRKADAGRQKQLRGVRQRKQEKQQERASNRRERTQQSRRAEAKRLAALVGEKQGTFKRGGGERVKVDEKALAQSRKMSRTDRQKYAARARARRERARQLRNESLRYETPKTSGGGSSRYVNEALKLKWPLGFDAFTPGADQNADDNEAFQKHIVKPLVDAVTFLEDAAVADDGSFGMFGTEREPVVLEISDLGLDMLLEAADDALAGSSDGKIPMASLVIATNDGLGTASRILANQRMPSGWRKHEQFALAMKLKWSEQKALPVVTSNGGRMVYRIPLTEVAGAVDEKGALTPELSQHIDVTSPEMSELLNSLRPLREVVATSEFLDAKVLTAPFLGAMAEADYGRESYVPALFAQNEGDLKSLADKFYERHKTDADVFDQGNYEVLPGVDVENRLGDALNVYWDELLADVTERLGKDAPHSQVAAVASGYDTLAGDVKAMIVGYLETNGESILFDSAGGGGLIATSDAVNAYKKLTDAFSPGNDRNVVTTTSPSIAVPQVMGGHGYSDEEYALLVEKLDDSGAAAGGSAVGDREAILRVMTHKPSERL